MEDTKVCVFEGMKHKNKIILNVSKWYKDDTSSKYRMLSKVEVELDLKALTHDHVNISSIRTQFKSAFAQDVAKDASTKDLRFHHLAVGFGSGSGLC